MTETEAGKLAREMPELDRRELSAMLAENTRATYFDGSRTAVRAIRDRGEDAQAQAWAVLHYGVGSGAYWAALS